LIADIDDGPIPVDWDDGAELNFDVSNLEGHGEEGAIFTEAPAPASNPKNYKKWETLFKRWLRTNKPLSLYKSATYKLVSDPGESEGDFRVRLQELANEKRDVAVEKLRTKYASKVAIRQERLRKAEQVIERESQQAKSKKLSTAISFGTAVLGGLLGRKTVSRTSASRMGTAIKSMGGLGKEKGDIKRARETAEAVQEQLEELNTQMEQEIEVLEDRFDAQDEDLTEIQVKATATNITVHIVALNWMPHFRDARGRLQPAYG
ncbi:MAG: ATP-binding protein, partial [Gammaproteobacteria bacterium]|nr:ATP-binding protein [Gammaproteobacteria bacterium]